MTDRELMQQALEALKSCSSVTHYPVLQLTIAALRERLAQPERIQLTVRDFVVTVVGIEEAVGTPTYWAEWPTKKNP